MPIFKFSVKKVKQILPQVTEVTGNLWFCDSVNAWGFTKVVYPHLCCYRLIQFYI